MHSFRYHWLCQPGWVRLIVCLWLMVSSASRADAQRPDGPLAASAARLRALLGPRKTEPLTIREEQTRLWAAHEQWAREPLRFAVWSRLGINYVGLRQPDSLYLCMQRARHAAQGLATRYPVEYGIVMGHLADYHWQRQSYDSATHYYRRQMQSLALAGADTLQAKASVFLADSLSVGRLLARAAANTGLGIRRHGDLVIPLRYYERSLRLFEHIQYVPGQLWGLALLGEAYEEQGNDVRAAYFFDRGLTLIRQARASAPCQQLDAFAELVKYNHGLLLRHGRAMTLRLLTQEGADQLPAALADRPQHPWEAYAAAAQLAVRGLEAELALGASPQAALQLADQRLADLYRVTAGHQHLRAPHEYYELRAEYEALHAWAGPPIIRTQVVQRALAFRDSVSSQAARQRLASTLADHLLRARQPYAALALLHEAAASARLDVPRMQHVLELQAEAYAALGRYDSAFVVVRSAHALADTLRAARQYAALTDVETHYRTQQKEAEIGRLQTQSEAQRRGQLLAWLSAGVLALGLAGLGYWLFTARRLNRALAEQRRQIQRQADQLTELDRAKSQFFANVSHELRTPLTLIVGPVEHLLDDRALPLPAPARQQLRLILRSGQRLQKLVSSLLDLSKLDAGKLRLQLAPVKAAPFLRQLVGVFASPAEYQRLTLRSEVALPEDLTLLLDADKVEQVLTNLLSNALKFTPSGGEVSIRVGAGAAPDEWVAAVCDTGPGIAAAEQALVFERFYQSIQRQAHGGTGIGLALSRELAELMHGSLTLLSEPGAGSTFTFRFRATVVAVEEAVGALSPVVGAPQSDEYPAAAEPAEEEVVGGLPAPRPRLLVVEDDPDLRFYLLQILQSDYQVLEAENGAQALRILATEAVDLISSDSMMPEMGGLELFQRVRANPLHRLVPFLMLTARADEDHRLTVLEAGVDDYLPKPFLPRELLARLRNLHVNARERRRWAAGAEVRQTVATASAIGVRETPLPVDSESPETPAPDDVFGDALRALIPGVLTDPEFAPATLAQQMFLSERTLYRRLKEQTGLTPAGWLREVRLDHARVLLEAGRHETVAAVAYAAGFTDPDHFGQLFRKRFGKKPSEYLV